MLLLVLMTGLSITSFTEGWLTALPFHDHLIVGARALGLVHHAHHGDDLDRAQRAIISVEARFTPGQPHDDGVVSLRPLSAQPELNTYTAQGWVVGQGVPLPSEAGLIAFLVALLLAVGVATITPSPPPRFA